MKDFLKTVAEILLKILLHIVIGTWIILNFLPESLNYLILIIYYCYLFGKLICGGFLPKQKNNE